MKLTFAVGRYIYKEGKTMTTNNEAKNKKGQRKQTPLWRTADRQTADHDAKARPGKAALTSATYRTRF